MAGRELTPGELEVKLDGILGRLTDIQNSMLTKELFEAYRDASNDRIRRTEDDLKEWTKVSTSAHVELDSNSKARHAETEARIDAEVQKLVTRLDKADERDFQLEQLAKANSEGRIKMYVTLALGGVVTIVTSLIISFFTPGGAS